MPQSIAIPGEGTWVNYAPTEVNAAIARLQEALELQQDPSWPPECVARFDTMQREANIGLAELQSVANTVSNFRSVLQYGDTGGDEWGTGEVNTAGLAALERLDADSVLIFESSHRTLQHAISEAAALRSGCGSLNLGTGLAVLGGMALLVGVVAVFGKVRKP